jgi:DNA-binding beta-propeller fold protein YncE
VSRSGGVARVSAFANLDTVVWSGSDTLPSLSRVLGFDGDAGVVAAADTRDRPLWLDLRNGTLTVGTIRSVRDLVTADGSNIFGVGADGAVARFAPSGNWVGKMPRPARAAFPQSTGTLVVLGGSGSDAHLWRLRPPEHKLVDSLGVPGVENGTEAPLGERIYLSAGKTLFAVTARTFSKGRDIRLDHSVRAIAASPSGDRVYVLTDSSQTLNEITSTSDQVTSRIDLPGEARGLRVDPLGRYVLVRAAHGDSLWVVSVGTDRVVAGMRSSWRGDVPFVAPDGTIATLMGSDVTFIDPSNPRRMQVVTDGAQDFWYPFVWQGFRPRSAALDRPADFGRDSDTVDIAPPAAGAPVTRTPVAPAAPLPPTDTARAQFNVSFAVLLDEAKARAQAAKIVVDGKTARVVTGVTDGTAVYRVVLGPYATREQADRAGRASGRSYYIYAGSP